MALLNSDTCCHANCPVLGPAEALPGSCMPPSVICNAIPLVMAHRGCSYTKKLSSKRCAEPRVRFVVDAPDSFDICSYVPSLGCRTSLAASHWAPRLPRLFVSVGDVELRTSCSSARSRSSCGQSRSTESVRCSKIQEALVVLF